VGSSISRNRLCLFDNLGNLSSFNPNFAANVVSLATDGNNLYVGGVFVSPSPRLAIYDLPSTTWNGTTWSNGNPSNTVNAIIASNTAPASFTCKA
jgi:hypothetical protein